MKKVVALVCFFGAAAFVSAAESSRIRYVKNKLADSGWTKEEMGAVFQDPRLQKIPPQNFPHTRIDWSKFIQDILQKESVERGVKFLEAHAGILEKADRKYGADPEVIAAIFRIETNFGLFLGDYAVVNVFYTGTLNVSSGRWRWHADNLAAMLIYCKNSGLDCFSVNGSYAGAFGLPQFLPVSVLNFGEDGDGDGKIDLFNTNDAVMSTARFLFEHDWTADKIGALAAYYGSGNGYPKATLAYAEALFPPPQ